MKHKKLATHGLPTTMHREWVGLCRLKFEERAGAAQNAVGRRLLQLMATKRSNLAVAADVTSTDRLLALADEVLMYDWPVLSDEECCLSS